METFLHPPRKSPQSLRQFGRLKQSTIQSLIVYLQAKSIDGLNITSGLLKRINFPDESLIREIESLSRSRDLTKNDLLISHFNNMFTAVKEKKSIPLWLDFIKPKSA